MRCEGSGQELPFWLLMLLGRLATLSGSILNPHDSPAGSKIAPSNLPAWAKMQDPVAVCFGEFGMRGKLSTGWGMHQFQHFGGWESPQG